METKRKDAPQSTRQRYLFLWNNCPVNRNGKHECWLHQIRSKEPCRWRNSLKCAKWWGCITNPKSAQYFDDFSKIFLHELFCIFTNKRVLKTPLLPRPKMDLKYQNCFYQNGNDNFTLSCGNRICLDSPKLDATTFLMLFFFHVSSFMFK